MPLAATGLVICWNFPMNRARASHSSLEVIRVCLSRSCSTKSNTSAVTAADDNRSPRGSRSFGGRHRLVDEPPVVIAHGLVGTVGADIRAIDREARDHFLDRRNQAVQREVAEVAVPFGEAIQLVSERI